MKFLLAKGARLQLKDSFEKPALVAAVLFRHYGSIELLLNSSQLDKTDLWRALMNAVYGDMHDMTVLLFEKCLHVIIQLFCKFRSS